MDFSEAERIVIKRARRNMVHRRFAFWVQFPILMAILAGGYFGKLPGELVFPVSLLIASAIVVVLAKRAPTYEQLLMILEDKSRDADTRAPMGGRDF